jgi:cell division protein FtsI/penicillin-binding protein 2
MVTAGKTGTAADPDFARTNGWFVGLAPAAAPRIVLVIYVPNGYGGDGAAIAHRFYLSASTTLLQVQSQ